MGSSNLLLEGNHIHNNGIVDSIYEHNNYTESRNITFQYNHFGPLRDGCLGNNLKDRSAGTVIRYNWIEAGNRQFDLVESDYRELVDDPAYSATHVYGNVLIEPDGAGKSQIVHYGGDGGGEAMYRRGVLHFYHNTVVSTRSGNTTLLRLSTNDVSAEVRNNVISVAAAGETLAVCSGTGQIELAGNWLPSGYRDTHESELLGQITAQDNLDGTAPGFVDVGAAQFWLASDSVCQGAAGPLPSGLLPDLAPTWQYTPHQGGEPRPDADALSIGALGPG